MMRARRKYSRSPGMFYLRRWSENIAVKATKARLNKVDGLLIEIAGFWGEEDEYICRQMDELRDHIADVAKLVFEGHAGLVEQRRLDREADQ
jgi:hypothetical protein